MYEVKIEDYFSGAHYLRCYHGKCEDLHGHNWKVEVFITSESVNEGGMVLDFQILKKETKTVLESIDHKFLNELDIFSESNPSAENIARYIFNKLKPVLESYKVSLAKVSVWESERTCASYMEGHQP